MSSHVSRLRLRDAAALRAQRTLLDGERLSQRRGSSCSIHRCSRSAGSPTLTRATGTATAVYFTVNRQLNPRIVRAVVPFCDYSKKPNDPDALRWARPDQGRTSTEIHEIHIVGGLHNKWRFEDYLNVIRWVKEAKSDLKVKAFTAVEIDFFCRSQTEGRMGAGAPREAGSTPCRVAVPRWFQRARASRIFHQKIGAQRWLEIHGSRNAWESLRTATCSTATSRHVPSGSAHDPAARARSIGRPDSCVHPLVVPAWHDGLVRRQASATRTSAPSRSPGWCSTTSAREELLDHARPGHGRGGDHFGASDLDGTIGVEKIAMPPSPGARSAWPKSAWSI